MKNVTLVKQSYQNDTLLPSKCNKQQNQFGSSDQKLPIKLTLLDKKRTLCNNTLI